MASPATREQVEINTPLPLFDYRQFDATPLEHDPFDYIVVPDFVVADARNQLIEDFPTIEGPGNFTPPELSYGPSFAQLLDELTGERFRDAFERKFAMDLSDTTPNIGIRKFCETTDGRIHTDHKTKVITLLIYFNADWPHDGGQLRMMRSGYDIEDYAAEVAPLSGTLLAFRRTENSLHGHKQFVGQRRMLQMSFVAPSIAGDMQRQMSRLTKPIRRLLNMS